MRGHVPQPAAIAAGVDPTRYTPLAMLLSTLPRARPVRRSIGLLLFVLLLALARLSSAGMAKAQVERGIPLAPESAAWGHQKLYIASALLVLIQAGLIAVLIAQRTRLRRAQRGLDERLAFEKLLSELSVLFAEVPAREIDGQFAPALRRVIAALGLDRARLGEFMPDGRIFLSLHVATAEGIPIDPTDLSGDDFPWTTEQMRRGRVVRYSRLDELPPEATVDRQSGLAIGTRSMIAIPLIGKGGVSWVLALSTLRRERAWPGDLVQRLELLGSIFANALARKAAETAAEESEGRFRLAADTAPVMMWMSGSDAGCTYFNRGWLEFTGRRPEEELGDGWAEGVHPDDRAACLNSYLQAFNARAPFTLEYRLRRFDGQYRWLLDHGVPRFSRGEFRGYIGTCVDVTELRATQRALLETASLRGAIFLSLYGHVAALDVHGTIIAVNAAWARFAEDNGGAAAKVSVGANYLEVCRAARRTDDPEALFALEAIESVLQGKVRRASLEYPCHSPTQERWFEMTVERFERPEGGVIITHVDVTRQRRAEQEARLHREELAHALRVATMGEMAASLAHEINQPLTAILTNSQSAQLLVQAGRPGGGDLQEVLSDIASDARRAAQVIRRVRALFTKDHSERRPLPINELITEVTGLLSSDIKRHRIALHVLLGQDLPPVLGDPIQLQQVLLNLVLNACQAMAGVEAGSRELTIQSGEREPGLLEIRVRDTGPGVKELERIFEPFVTTKSGGLGMGLSISRSIVAAHGGRIWATRNPATGITVHVELLCEQPASSAMMPAAAQSRLPR
jgi:PAS domain S-box-containing protein